MTSPFFVEDWALAYIQSRDLRHKLSPPPPPSHWQSEPLPITVAAPGRPSELKLKERAAKAPRSLRSPVARAQLLHRFFHHELQAAELMCWALLRFCHAEHDFRQGLLRIALDEMRHMRLYEREILRLGCQLGDFPVRDWFWERSLQCHTAVQFVAFMGMGLEAANLEHAPAYAKKLHQTGDTQASAVQQRVGREELHHVRFAVSWFKRWTGDTCFQRWRRELPPPLTPLLMKGRELCRTQRQSCGMSDAFLDQLERFQPTHLAKDQELDARRD